MKAAVLYESNTVPKYADFPIPKVTADDQELVSVVSSSIKNLDRGKVSGAHYTAYRQFPTTIGVDGIGRLEDGSLIYAMGLTGMIAEKAIVKKGQYAVINDKDVDPYIAAALPNTLLGSDCALLFRGNIKKGDVVLVNGATGVTGKVAVQIAKIRGASKVIATGRNLEVLKKMQQDLGVDDIIHLNGDDKDISAQYKALLDKQPIDIVLDYLWGKPAELVINAIVSQKKFHITKIITVGEMAGANISLPSAALRSTAIEIIGSGLGSFEMSTLGKYFKNYLNELLGYVKEGKLKVDIRTVDLKDIEKEWPVNEPSVRTVIKI
ncbi:hypothetical protein DICPUDRAFT_25046 [Dictyostelium purpureum]|uniref:Alcohol dehydrogenase-like C-terminal domain-containing protein n=1 Tax=Dictyostelium purpureum TaxID=5786 RepID=F0Z6L2_DICPU|nr:uncharacterized protein DICPUDRAFT_25046 [Dictyostelium purpureum]EGC40515.1 hypothetical protein DICPUDRAFT_25046 [Dictyostelium purpureum]|eukprot:XP_003283062.1 hypothetical protein DICPUDRAFT_25046 [Dictyostelium purpureum]